MELTGKCYAGSVLCRLLPQHWSMHVGMDYDREKMGKRSQECRKDSSRVALCHCHTLFGMNLRPFG